MKKESGTAADIEIANYSNGAIEDANYTIQRSISLITRSQRSKSQITRSLHLHGRQLHQTIVELVAR